MIPLPEDMLDLITDYVKSKIKVKSNRMATIDPSFRADHFPEQLPKVVFDGESTISGKGYNVVGDYTPLPGERVLMSPVGDNYVIVGPVTSKNSLIRNPFMTSNLFDVDSESTSSTSYTDLNTHGPEVTVYTGKKALIIIGCQIHGDSFAVAGVEISGASNVSPADAEALMTDGNTRITGSKVTYFNNLVAGYNTFTMKYRITSSPSGEEAHFDHRQIIVMPL